MSLSSGDRVGLYEIVGPLGAGGTGEVYRARDTSPGVKWRSRSSRPTSRKTRGVSPASNEKPSFEARASTWMPRSKNQSHEGEAMIEERDGWFVKNVRDATWVHTEAFGKACGFDTENPFPQVGIHIFLLEPGKPNCRYHREEAQEDFLVLAGRCKLLVNGEERSLESWDFVHCPAGVSHVFVGVDDGPCALLAIGHRPGKENMKLFYPASELARRYNAESPEPTADPKIAYADIKPRVKIDPPKWPIESSPNKRS